MFKVSINQINRTEEEEIVIKCHEINDEVLSVMEKLKNSDSVLLGTKDNAVFRINIKDVFYIESVDNKVFICTQKNVYESKLKLYQIEDALDGTKFLRCSKSMIVNLGKIRSVTPSISGRLEAGMQNGETIIISRQYVSALKKKLGMWGWCIMKNVIKLVATHFFIITVCVLAVTGLSYILDGEKSIPLYYPFLVIGIGLATALPSAIFYFKKEPTKKQIYKRIPFHLLCIETIVLTVGYFIGWYNSFSSAIPIALSVIFIYLIVFLSTLFTHRNAVKDINKALEKYNSDEENN